MTDGTQTNELDELKAQATDMGLTFHPKIGAVKLKEKIANRLAGIQQTTAELGATPIPKASVTPIKKPESIAERNIRLRKESARLIRIRVSCMNPNKKEYEGEYFTVSNSVVGTFKKYVAYNNEDGWHVPNIILEHLKERECQIFYTVKGPRGNKIRKGKMIKEFAIEVLDPLSGAEMSELATRQAMANNLD